MDLTALLNRTPVVPWAQESKIPWHEPAFSKRMLREHLSQAHDRASHRFEVIDSHVAWIDDIVCHHQPSRILDLGCGPGLYTSRLANLGHTCVGIDFSPASIDYAKAQAEKENLACEYQHQDLCNASFGEGFDLVLMVFGELNTFHPDDTLSVLEKAHHALAPGGTLVLEVHTDKFIRELGSGEPSWFTATQNVFSDTPHLCLREPAWHQREHAATERYFVVELATKTVTTYMSTTQAYSEDEYRELLNSAGFQGIKRHASLSGRLRMHEGLFVWLAQKEV
ncbi:MAG: class I SAM-dependent methyltransferase [Pseudomonadota bacterium]